MSEDRIVKHPGEILLSEITKLNMKQKELAVRTGVSEKHISTVINGTKDISASFSRKLEIALGSPKGYWSNLQAEYDLFDIAFKEERGITSDEIDVLKSLKDITAYFIRKNIMHNDCPDSQKVIQLREILRINDLTQIPKIEYNGAYRAQVRSSTSTDPYVLFAWQRLCEIQTEGYEITVPFDTDKLRNKLPDIKKEMLNPYISDGIDSLKAIFAECGVAFGVIPHFRGAPVQGFIKQTDSGKVILCLTIRGKKADRFWFTLFHEIGHLLNGDINNRFVDFSSVSGDAEEKADKFARDTLIPEDPYKKFISNRDYTDLNKIKLFSQYIGVPHWITIGRLHNDEWLDWRIFVNEIPGYRWVESEAE